MKPLSSRIQLLILLPALALRLWQPAASAQDEVVVRGSTRFDVSLERFQGESGDEITRELSRIFRETDDFNLTSGSPGSFVVRGGGSSNQVSGVLIGPRGELMLRRDYRHGPLRSNVRAFADEVIALITGRPGMSSSRIVFVSGGAGRRKEIYVCDYDGENVTQLTRDGVISVSPSIHRQAGYVAYTSYKSGYPDVYTIDLASGLRTRIVNAPGTNGGAAISPDGRRIALTMSFSGNKELYTTNRNGGQPRALTRTQWSESSPAWSPNGGEIVYVSDQTGSPQLYRIRAGGGAPSMIRTGYAYCTEPDWSPDGSRLAFSARTGGRIVVAMVDFRTGKIAVLRAGEDPSWGPDSRHLVMTSQGDLVRVNVDTGAGVRLVTRLGNISEPSWSR